MTEAEIKDFARRISQSSKTEIVVISYEIIIKYIESAKKHYENGEIDDMVKCLKKAKQFVNDLSSNLDFKYQMSVDLMNLYLFSNKALLNAIIKRNCSGLDTVIHIMSNLKNSFEQVAKIDNRGAAINNADAVYAGLTYGNNSQLNEYCYSFDKKGFLM